MTTPESHQHRTVGAGDGGSEFERSRQRLLGRAYRVLGSFVDADDVVQETWLRWTRADRSTIENPEAWLNTVVTRLALDQLRRRKRDEAEYVGPWLPTPWVEPLVDPSEAAVVSDSLTSAFLVMLERLTPDERVAFLMADVFGEPFAAVAASMDRTPESCRQLASRARRKIRGAEVERRDSAALATAVADRFLAAIITGDEQSAIDCIAPDAVYISDGGATRRAARQPVVGPERIVRLFVNLAKRFEDDWLLEPAVVGGFPGFTISAGGEISSASSAEVVDGKIVRILTIMNPDKLSGLRTRPDDGEFRLG